MYNQDFNNDADVDEEDDFFNDYGSKISFGQINKKMGSKERKVERLKKNLDQLDIGDYSK